MRKDERQEGGTGPWTHLREVKAVLQPESRALDRDLEGCTVPDRIWEGEAILDARANMSKREDSRNSGPSVEQ